MTTGTFPDAWEEVAVVSMIRLGSSQCPLNFMTIAETVDIGEPEYPGESVPNLAGGRIWKQSPQEDGEVTLELYPTDLVPITGTSTLTAGGAFQLASSNNSIAFESTQPLGTDFASQFAAGVSRTRDKFMIAVLWTDDVAVTTNAFQATSTTDSVALRFYAKECRIISHKASYTDGILKVTLTLKFPAMNKAGTARCYAWESTNAGGTAQSPLPALTYTTAL